MIIMDESVKSAFKILREIKSVTLSTINGEYPASRIIDVMMIKDDGLYFVTGRGKPFYKQLKETKKIAVCGMNNDYISIRIVGDIEFCKKREIIDDIFEKNPMMNDIYPDEKRDILEAFKLYKGRGEIFNISKIPIKRTRFAYGGDIVNPSGYKINKNCISCGECYIACPEEAVKNIDDEYSINGEICIECGRCNEVCPADAIDSSKGI